MNSKSKTAKLVAGFVGMTVAFAMVVSPVFADTTSDLQAQVASLTAMLQSLQAQLNTANNGATVSTGYTFNTNLTVGSKGTDVLNLQKVLNMSADTKVAVTGAGSPGSETTTFGPATKAAVMKFQTKNGITPVSGYVGALTRAKLNSMGGSVVVNPSTGTTTPGLPTGGNLTVTAGSQPANNIAPYGAARVPFTKVILSAGSSDVTVNSITIQRSNLGVDANFAGVVLLDENGLQIGTVKTLNSNHQAMIGEPFVIKAGTSKTVTVAGNMGTVSAVQAGQLVGLDVVSINTTATVSGSTPIMGAVHTMNGNLVLGQSTPSRGALDPQGNVDKEIGTTGYTFSSVKVDAGSSEQLRLWSIRWNQTGSASSADLANVKVYVDGTAYDTTVSADGKYYSTLFPGGLLIDKGLSKEISIKGDIVSGSTRTVIFSLYKNTDIYLTGETYKYGITPASTGAGFTTGSPWYTGSTVNIKAGTASTISSSNTVGAQNIAVLVADQPLGGWDVKIRGEAVTVGQMIFKIRANGDSVSNITNIKLVNSNGVVVAGPVDGAGTEYGTVTFTDSVRFPVGDTTLRLVGRLGSTFVQGDTIQASTTPYTQWTNVLGESTGDTVPLASFSTDIQGNLMTVKAGALSMSVSSQPSARNFIAGAKKFEFARYVLDAGQSGEDIKLANFKALLALNTVTSSQLSNCALYDGTSATATNLTDASNVTLAASDNTFTFNNGGYVVPKGTSKTLSMRCDISSGATSGWVKWGLTDNSGGTNYTAATGVTSGLTIAESMVAAAGQQMSAATTGAYTVTSDSALLYKVVQAGTTGVELAKLRFTAGASEAVDLQQIALVLGNTASNSPSDLVDTKVTLWNGTTMIGTAQFGGANPDYATSTTLSPSPRIPAGESLVITVKGDLSAQNINDGTPGAFLAVSYDGNNNGINGNYGQGADSQVTVAGGTSGAVTTNGIRIFRTVPTIAVTSTGGTLSAGSDLYKFTVTNPNNRDVVFKKFSFSIATTSGTVSDFTLYGDGVAFNTSVAQTDAIGTLLEVNAAVTSQAKIIPANSTKVFVLRAGVATDVANVSETINIALLADTSYPSLSTLMGTVASVEAGSGNTDNIIWSPFSTTTPVADAATEANLDWTNGYGLPGFPANTAFPTQTWTRSN